MTTPSFDLGFDVDFMSLDEAGLILLDSLNADMDTDVLSDNNIVSMSQVEVNVDGGPSFEFLEADDRFMKLISEGGSNPSANDNKWARNRIDKYRLFRGLSVEVPIENLPHADCSTLLTRFFCQVTKKNGELYPSQTLMGLYRAIHRILKRGQEVRVQQTGVDELPFSLRTSPLFKTVGVSCVLAMERSKRDGANLPRKKSAVISLADESSILSHSCTSIVHARGLQARSIYYLLCRFAIRGGQELYNLTKTDLKFGADEAGRFVRYDERLSKNYRVSLDRYQEEHFRPAVTSHDPDVVLTLDTLISHLPVSGTFLFYQCIDSPRSHAWFSTLRMSARKLTGFMRLLHDNCGLTSQAVTNKSGRTTCVTRMSSEGVPPAIGMRITGHKSQGAYVRYDRSLEAQVRAAQKCVGEGSSYETNVQVETDLFKRKIISGETEDQGPAEKKINAATAIVPITPLAAVGSPKVEAAGQGSIEGGSDACDKELGWMDAVDWDNIMSPYDTPTIINPINAFFGKIGSMEGCTFNITVNKN